MPRNTDPIGSSIWLRPARSRGGQPTLSREQIVRAALELLDAEGGEGLSMRRLGTKLGAGATSLYWYVANKDELLDLILDEVMGEIAVPDPDGDWRTAIGAFAREVRAMMLRHPWITRFFGVRPAIGPKAMNLSERGIVLLESAGFTGLDIAYASSMVMAYAIGAATAEAAWHTALRESGMTAAELEKSIEAHGEAFTAGHPHYEQWWRATPMPEIAKLHEDTFAFGIERLLDGLQAWLNRAPE